MQIEVRRSFTIPYPGTPAEAIAFLRDVGQSLSGVSFIKNLRVEGSDVFADLAVDVPFLGEQRLDFHSRLEARDDGADLIGLERDGKAWAKVSGEGRVTPIADGASIQYALHIIIFIALPSSEKWGGKAFEKMAQATAAKAIERLTLEFPRGVTAGIEAGSRGIVSQD
jgi:carbon monoxide dehydrogenase subunit G